MKNAGYLWGLPLRVPGIVSFSFFVFHFTITGYPAWDFPLRVPGTVSFSFFVFHFTITGYPAWDFPLRVPGTVSFSFFVFHFTITLCTEPSFSVITYAPRLIGIDVSPSGRSTRFTSWPATE